MADDVVIRMQVPADRTEHPISDDWRTGTKTHEVGVAHFYINGVSLCYEWRTTRFDRPSQDSDQRCERCADRRS